jgi:hypothetical protein
MVSSIPPCKVSIWAYATNFSANVLISEYDHNIREFSLSFIVNLVECCQQQTLDEPLFGLVLVGPTGFFVVVIIKYIR